MRSADTNGGIEDVAIESATMPHLKATILILISSHVQNMRTLGFVHCGQVNRQIHRKNIHFLFLLLSAFSEAPLAISYVTTGLG